MTTGVCAALAYLATFTLCQHFNRRRAERRRWQNWFRDTYRG